VFQITPLLRYRLVYFHMMGEKYDIFPMFPKNSGG
jgi:hypothetical protein